jgi:hypothetical protein
MQHGESAAGDCKGAAGEGGSASPIRCKQWRHLTYLGLLRLLASLPMNRSARGLIGLRRWRWKSFTQPDGGEGLAKRKASSRGRFWRKRAAKSRPEETRTGYEAYPIGRAS